MNKKNKSISIFKIVAYALTAFFCIMALFPLFYAFSLSLQDPSAIYSVSPKFLPSIGQEVHITIEASPNSDENTLDELKKTATAALYGTYYGTRNTNLERIYVDIVDGEKTIFHTDAYIIFLKFDADYGAFEKVIINPKTILSENMKGEDRYKLAMESIGYEYHSDGFSTEKFLNPVNNDLSNTIENLLISKYDLNIPTNGVVSGKGSIKTKFVDYYYYFKMPQFAFKNYPLIAKYGFFAFMFNTLLTVLVAILCQVTIPAITAYPLAVLFKRSTSNALMTFFLLTMMIPFVCIMIPQLVLLKSLGMYDNYRVMLFPWLLPAPFYILLYKGFFENIPRSYFEAAKIDGANELSIFLKVCIPLSGPIISLIAIQSFISGWTDFMWYYVSTKRVDLWTVNLAVFNLNNSLKNSTNLIMGLSICMIIPVIIVVAMFSKQIKQSVMGAGVKG